MSSVPRAQFTNSEASIVASSGSSYSSSGRFLPSIARRTRFYPDQQRCADNDVTGSHVIQQTPSQRRVCILPSNEGYDPGNGVSLNMRHRPSFGVERGVESPAKDRRWIYRRTSEEVGSSSPDHPDIQKESSPPLIQGTWQSNPNKVLSFQEETNRKLDRKAIARRHLVVGLTGGTHILDKGGTPGVSRGRDDTRRASSFNCHAGELGLPTTSNGKHCRSTTNSLLKNRAVVRRHSGTDRAREALDNFNTLVHELHAEYHQEYLRQGSTHLAVLSDAGADSSGASHKELLEDEDGMTSGKTNAKLARTSSLTFTDMKFPVGIGFTRYRPLTPNLLLKLDKLKMPAKRRTQQWINNIQGSTRTLSKSSLMDTPIGEQVVEDETGAIRKSNEQRKTNIEVTLPMVETVQPNEDQTKACIHDFL
ncbi:hypothetical protein ElyMa_004727600 [Elysia marginata]|uniref:Uncharacterized protein n=1 Tax=Elysia marginata TaxID=1093978 RepID=A0AAV4IA64_9GAST|nr:hypothetical protein ElyMa_004727600 [Elysia marginata]